MADPKCPNCGADAWGGYFVCNECGKVFCAECERRGKSNYQTGGVCVRCGSDRVTTIRDWSEMREALRNSQN